MSLGRLLPVYLVVFVGFVGYSTMITVFTPMFLQGHGRLIPPDTATGEKTILLGLMLCMYPLGQFLSAPPIGALSDKYGRRRVLLISLMLSIFCYGLIAGAIAMENFWLHESIQATHDRFGLAQDPFTSRCAFIGAIGTDKQRIAKRCPQSVQCAAHRGLA